jgi:NTP pyrophosphatase (non-canonical NTP hydrolase)
MEELLTLPDLLAHTSEITQLFDQLVGPWTPVLMMTELTAEVGTLADGIMIVEQHRSPRQNTPPIDLADDLADVLFMLLRLADHYCIDLQEAYTNMLTSTRLQLEQQLASQEGREDADLVLIKPFNREDVV